MNTRDDMSLRTAIAKDVMAALAATDLHFGTGQNPYNPWPWCAEQAVKAADALIAELNK